MEAAADADINTTVNHLKVYTHICATIHKTGVPDIENPMTSDLVTTVLTQYHVSKGLKFFGKKGKDAVLRKLKQLHDKMVMNPKQAESLTKEDKKKRVTLSNDPETEERRKD